MHLCQLIIDIIPAAVFHHAGIRISEVNEIGFVDLRVSSEIANPGFAPSAPALTELFPNSGVNSF
jgi:hypothetical protein